MGMGMGWFHPHPYPAGTIPIHTTPVPTGFKLPHDQQKYDGSQEPQSWLSDYLQAVKNTRKNKGDSNANSTITSHRRSQVMVE
jgi:hypothetical protein